MYLTLNQRIIIKIFKLIIFTNYLINSYPYIYKYIPTNINPYQTPPTSIKCNNIPSNILTKIQKNIQFKKFKINSSINTKIDKLIV